MGHRKISRLIVISLVMVFVAALAASCGMSKKEARENVVSGLDGAGSKCMQMYLVGHGDKFWKESDHLKPACVPYEQIIVTYGLEQKEGSGDSAAWRIEARYTYAGTQPPMKYMRTFWFAQEDEEMAEAEVESMLELGATKE